MKYTFHDKNFLKLVRSIDILIVVSSILLSYYSMAEGYEATVLASRNNGHQLSSYITRYDS
jgi:hypothetical protein